jgi:hypothetical protein
VCVVKSFNFSCLGSDASADAMLERERERGERKGSSRKHTFSNFLFFVLSPFCIFILKA